MQRILVVTTHDEERCRLLDMLSTAGYRTAGAASYEEATRWLAGDSPDLVIADERLGAYNGLHVILRARAGHPRVKGIVTTAVNSWGLEADARRLNIRYLVKPDEPSQWLAPIAKALMRRQFRSPRSPLTPQPAGVAAPDGWAR